MHTVANQRADFSNCGRSAESGGGRGNFPGGARKVRDKSGQGKWAGRLHFRLWGMFNPVVCVPSRHNRKQQATSKALWNSEL